MGIIFIDGLYKEKQKSMGIIFMDGLSYREFPCHPSHIPYWQKQPHQTTSDSQREITYMGNVPWWEMIGIVIELLCYKNYLISEFEDRKACNKQDKINTADSAFIFLTFLLSSQNRRLGWSGRRIWSGLVWSLLDSQDDFDSEYIGLDGSPDVPMSPWYLCPYICEKCEMSRLWHTHTRTVESRAVFCLSKIRNYLQCPLKNDQ